MPGAADTKAGVRKSAETNKINKYTWKGYAMDLFQLMVLAICYAICYANVVNIFSQDYVVISLCLVVYDIDLWSQPT